jgi:hypothetical protein
MQRFKSFLHEGKNTPHAIWVVGGAASGKSTVAEKAIVSDLKFTLIDVDKPFEEMLKQFNLSPDIKKSTPEQLEKSRARKKKNDALIKAGKMKAPTKMADMEDPMDFLKGSKPTTNRVSVVAREKTRRLKDSTIKNLQNVVFVETGGQIGRIRNEKAAMEKLGYNTFIVYVGVYADLDLNLPVNFNKVRAKITERGLKRAKEGGRNLDPKILETSLKQSVKVQKELVPLFGKNTMVVDTAQGSVSSNQKKVTQRIKKWLR